jgi:D-glycero-alpha-D-manno-heptose-7-phosphate kinase
VNQLVNKLMLSKSDSILTAIGSIESSRFQIAFVVDGNKRLVGIVTNGDIRRFLLHGGETDSSITACMNGNYRFIGPNSTREELLKLFDLGFGVIPKVDADGKLIDLITPDYAISSPEAPILTRSRAPVRVSFGGGGSDLTYLFVDNPGAVLSTTVALYSHVTLIPRSDHSIHIHSEDLKTYRQYPSILELLEEFPKNDLLTSVVAVIKPGFGFDLYVRSDFPVGSGLGGSSCVATAVIAAFNEMRQDKWTTYEIAELAFHAERVCFGVAGGWQDQYASAFGGFNLIELGEGKNLVHPIRLDKSTLNELEECLILCDTQMQHDSGILHQEQRNAFSNGDKVEKIREVVALCREMHHHLIRGELLDFGRCLDKAWNLKAGLSPSISNQRINEVYKAAVQAGAVGGKLLGAGAGGFFLFFVQPQHRQKVTKTLHDYDCRISLFKFETEGVISWRTKIA